MPFSDIEQYIRDSLDAGIPCAIIKEHVVSQGYEAKVVDDVIASVNEIRNPAHSPGKPLVVSALGRKSQERARIEEYVKDRLKAGFTPNQIKERLFVKGKNPMIVDDIVEQLRREQSIQKSGKALPESKGLFSAITGSFFKHKAERKD